MRDAHADVSRHGTLGRRYFAGRCVRFRGSLCGRRIPLYPPAALGHEDQVGTIRVGRKADLVVVKGDPLANLKLLFGTGTLHLDDRTGKVERIGGIAWAIKDGILYDAQKLRAEIRKMVADAKAARGLPPGPMPVVSEATQ